ncbi:hypothetical protein ACERC8_01330 [Streptococcus sp. E29BA]|uniref:hypothetical protein n=1 Tax=Streptococcus sp. E29BA TaxID=3278716 RepID=UPI00359EEB1C
MENVIATLTELFEGIVPESHFLSNPSADVLYPYLVFSYEAEQREWGQDGAYIDVDIFDNRGENQERIEFLLGQLKRELEHKAVMAEDFYLRLRYEGSNPLDTLSDVLQRRHARFYVTIDWRREYE